MCSEIVVRLLIAHVVGDFVFQTDGFCAKKLKYGLKSCHTYIHGAIIGALSWLALWSWPAWWVAVLLGASHLMIDTFKKSGGLKSFILDQLVHIIVVVLASAIVIKKALYGAICCDIRYMLFIMVFLLNAKPTNIFIKLLLREYSVNLVCSEGADADNVRLKSGKLIGNIERWLIIIFILCEQYEAIGFLIAAKSIIRYKEGDTTKTEYVLAGTLLSVFIAVISGLLLKL